jgi:hypothetical protein
MAVTNLTYVGVDYSFIAPDHGYEALITELWIIVPGIVPRDLTEFAKQQNIGADVSIAAHEYQKWRNHWCDVHSMLAHINAKRDIFVTGDKKNFKGERLQKLIDLGIGDICTYDDAWAKYGAQ